MTEQTTETRSIVLERQISHSPEKIWRALTQCSLIQQWLMSNDFQPHVGHNFNFRAAPMPHWNGVVDCEVLAIEPYTRLSYTWNASGDETATGIKTIVTFTLTPTEDGALLRMEQSGFRPHEDANIKGAEYGWQQFLNSLERVVGALD
jgi:uncharacterized protein YndB with AHSA1/START domain